MTDGQKAQALDYITTTSSTDAFIVITDHTNNVVAQISKADLLASFISGDAGGMLVQGTDDCLYVLDCRNASNITSGTLNALRLPNSGVTAGEYTSANITVDAYGRITDAVNGSGGGGVVNFSDAGIISANFTLAVDTITYGHVSGNYTLTLPTITDFTKQKECIFDFTTVNASYPSITNTNIDKKDGKSITPSATLSTAKTITGATNANPIVITCTGHGYQSGDTVTQASLGGTNTNAVGTFYPITVIDANSYSIPVAGNGTYTSGGTSQKYITRNRLTFKSIIGKNRWEVELEQFGGVETAFIMPVLSADGTVGGTSVAVSMTNAYSGIYAYMAYDGNAGTASMSTSPQEFITYFPYPVKIPAMTFTGVNTNAGAYSHSMYGSLDGSTYILLGTASIAGGTGVATQATYSTTGFFKYYKEVNIVTAGSYVQANKTLVNPTCITQ